MKLKHIINRRGNWHYRRRVPKDAIELDERGPVIQFSLKTDELEIALQRRDVHDLANEALWQGLIRADDAAWRNYEAAVRLASTLGRTYKVEAEIAKEGTLDDILARIEDIKQVPGTSKFTASALLGFHERPKHTVSQAFDLYISEIASDDVRYKSAEQRKSWEKVKRRAKNNFVSIVGDKPILEITRDDARKMYNHWRKRIDAGEVAEDTGNRDIGNMRGLVREYCKYAGIELDKNPFDDLSFKEPHKKRREPFSQKWIREKMLAPNVLKDLDPQLQSILYVSIDTGARPSEISNLLPENIMLDCEVPHIVITPILEGEHKREIKTQSSIRQIPLVGLALKSMRDNPLGFKRYRHKGNLLSANFAGWLDRNELREKKGQSLYCLRHTFEDRMKVAGVDSELRMLFMGHTSKRPQYGSDGGLNWQRDELQKIVW